MAGIMQIFEKLIVPLAVGAKKKRGALSSATTTTTTTTTTSSSSSSSSSSSNHIILGVIEAQESAFDMFVRRTGSS